MIFCRSTLLNSLWFCVTICMRSLKSGSSSRLLLFLLSFRVNGLAYFCSFFSEGDFVLAEADAVTVDSSRINTCLLFMTFGTTSATFG